tara:strand:- start:569 stop:2053 length:1485 start_codon:yes stop_codon:yes gene_type:complete
MKQIIKKFNNLIKKTIFKLENKTNDKFTISSFNKYLISAVILLFFYLFYLLIPTFYDKKWVQTSIESGLLDEFKINLSTSGDISYRILPKPHFLIKDSKILEKNLKKKKSIAEIKDLKVFISQSNFLNKKAIDIQKIKLNNVNFSVLRKNIVLLNSSINGKFSNKKIEVNKGNIFFKDNLGETISIIKIYQSLLFFDEKQLLNIIDLSGEVFNIPFIIKSENKINNTKNKKVNIQADKLRLNIFNESNIDTKGLLSGKNIISFLNSTINTKYDVKKKLITFISENSRLNNSKVNYNGELSINPFDLRIDIKLVEYKISQLLNINSILIEFIKTGLLFNENISLDASIIANSNIKDEIFQGAHINFHIVNGKINFDNTKFINNEIGFLELKNSNFFFKDNNLILNTDILIDIKSSKHLFSFFNTGKTSRKDFKKILINLDYNFLSNQLKFNSAKIDNNEFSDQLFTIIEGFEDNNFNNIIKSRVLVNEFLRAYAG